MFPKVVFSHCRSDSDPNTLKCYPDPGQSQAPEPWSNKINKIYCQQDFQKIFYEFDDKTTKNKLFQFFLSYGIPAQSSLRLNR